MLNELGDRLADVAFFAGAALAPGSSPLLGTAVLVAMLLSSYLGTVARPPEGGGSTAGSWARPTG